VSEPRASAAGQPPPLDAAAIGGMAMTVAPNRILSAAVQLGVFPAIAAGHATAAELATTVGANARALRMLLDALAGVGLLGKADGRYALTEVARQHLLPDSPDYVGAVFEGDHLWEAWAGLTDAIRSGTSRRAVESDADAAPFFSRLVRTLHVVNLPIARRAAQALFGSEHRAGLEIIDIGCGSGVWGIGMAEAQPAAHLTLQDLPEVLDAVAREKVARHGLAGRTRFLSGSFREMELGSGDYDLAILGNIIHMEGDDGTRSLFRKAHRALRPGGRLLVIDMFPNDDRSGPAFPLIFALNMLVATNAGDTYTLAELRPWLRDAGFTTIDTLEIGHHSPLLVAGK
jgi:ubiquinone/menaquinone biosynthesis C-methylase UbiE